MGMRERYEMSVTIYCNLLHLRSSLYSERTCGEVKKVLDIAPVPDAHDALVAQGQELLDRVLPPRKRGRPKGSKNKRSLMTREELRRQIEQRRRDDADTDAQAALRASRAAAQLETPDGVPVYTKATVIPGTDSPTDIILSAERIELLRRYQTMWPEIKSVSRRLALAGYVESCFVSGGALMCGARESDVMSWVKRDEKFRLAWEEAEKMTLARFEDKLMDWALNGQHDNAHFRALELVLKSRDPKKYSERYMQAAGDNNLVAIVVTVERDK